jgi:ubiquinone/menaquinone biosynthesis C-methylase UbiE
LSTTEWGERAAQLYGADYARKYRTMDDVLRAGPLVARFGGWIRELCESFGRPITVLDLGCGTGRYFWAVRHATELVGIDVSAAMLAEARRPVDAGHLEVSRVTLIEGDFLTQPLGQSRFDFVYSIGVLGEHTPFDARVAARVHRVLAPGGLFAFTAVHANSFSIPRTAKRRLGERLLPIAPGPVRSALRQRLLAGGLYVDPPYVRDVLTETGFKVDSIEYHESDVHLHCLCVGRKPRG